MGDGTTTWYMAPREWLRFIRVMNSRRGPTPTMLRAIEQHRELLAKRPSPPETTEDQP